MIQELGTICNKSESTSKLATEIKIGFQKIQIFKKLKFLYFIWKNPYMVVGRNTFINNLLEMIGLENCTEQSRYLSFDGDEIQKMDVDITFLSTEPYKFREKHIKEFSELTPASKIILLDGKVCSWYGSRLKYFPQYINELLRVS